MFITATELKANLGKYLLLAATEDVFITHYGKVVANLTSPFQDRIEIAESLFGILPQATTLEEAMEKGLTKYLVDCCSIPHTGKQISTQKLALNSQLKNGTIFQTANNTTGIIKNISLKLFLINFVPSLFTSYFFIFAA